MKSRCMQIFLFQLLLFWWAYCSLFPWHPAAILQLLVFTSLKEGGGGKPSPLVSPAFSAQKIWRERGGETRDITTQIEITPTVTPGERAALKIIVRIPKQEPGSVLSASCVIPALQNCSDSSPWLIRGHSDVMPNTSRKKATGVLDDQAGLSLWRGMLFPPGE